MKKIVLLIFSLAIGVNYNSVAADTIASRSFASCGYVGHQIYCCGGDTSSSLTSGNTIDTNLYYLNISQFTGKSSDLMNSQWSRVTPAIPFSIEHRRAPTSIVLPDGERFLIQGGKNLYGNKLTNQSIIFNTASNTWSKSTSFGVQNRGTRQIYHSTAVNLPDNLIGFYGGLEQIANTAFPEITLTGETMPFDANNGSYVGFNNLTMFTSGSAVWSVFSPQNSPPANFYPNSQTATIDPSSGKIYYIGGDYYTPDGNPIKASLSWSIVFETKSGSWLNETLRGTIPTDRTYHTSNLLPNSQDIILYGGSGDGLTASVDYCFTLNLLTNEWTKHDNLNIPTYLSGHRFSHSAVLVDSTLFVLFGRGLDGALSPPLLTIDVTSVSNISYTSIYNAPIIAPNSPINPNSNTNGAGKENEEVDATSGGLSKGATGGIAAGCVVAGLAIIAAIIFYVRRQKKAKKEENTHENMDVDWDKIEDHYKEIPIATSNSPQLTESTDLTGNTLVSSTDARNISANLTEQPVENNAMTSRQLNINPDVSIDMVKPSTDMLGNYTIVKPEGNHS